MKSTSLKKILALLITFSLSMSTLPTYASFENKDNEQEVLSGESQTPEPVNEELIADIENVEYPIETQNPALVENEDEDEVENKSDKILAEQDDVESSEKPYVISPDEFGEFEDYEKISLIYYNDGVLTDENNEIVDDINEIVGEDSLKHFGEYEEDSVFVRNDKLKCDYEILYDLRKYKNVSDNFRSWGVDGIKYEKKYK